MNRPNRLAVGLTLAAALCLVPATLSAQDPRGGGGGGAADRGGSAPAGGAADRGGSSGGSSVGSSSSGSSYGGSSGGDSGSWGGGAGRGLAMARRAGGASPSGSSSGSRYAESGSGGESRAIPWYSRGREGRPVVGTPAGRQEVVRPGGGGYWDRYWDPYTWANYAPTSYYNRGYWGNAWYGNCGSMWGFGAFGMGAFYYDPSWWSYGATGYPYGGCLGLYSGYGYGYDPFWGGMSFGGGGNYYGRYQESNANAGLKLKVKPSDAQVFVDGYFAGEVDEFDSTFQRLPLAPGMHHIEIRAAGHEPLEFDITLERYQVITYKGELKPR